ncbi:J domain-containing protein [Dyella nitratireducens]|uniref:J domain-containing protein n=1 Tax=Dyella nitratireducens TaxID=1849580 RepID=A0ABQ1GWJ7_9GAMM|nr:hypothetical protein GCM10010981_45990 [Dyella nitratireducens]GLQ41708.1 hypothetical protein GCM10007902_15580 [Dyella nitratireducens]
MKWRNIPNAYQDRIAELTAQLEQDPFAVLGIEASASDDEIRLAYRKRVRAYHPDRQDEFIRLHAQEVIKIVNSAYERICRVRGM